MYGFHLLGSLNRLTSRSTIAVCVSIGSCLVLEALRVTAQEPPSNNKSALEQVVPFAVQSDPMPTPLVLLGDPQQAKITSIAITGQVPTGENGTAELTLGESMYAFNDFGDASVAQVKLPRKFTVQLKLESRALMGLIFELTSKELRLQTHLFLVLSSIPANPSRLIIGEPRRSPLTEGGEHTSVQPDALIELHAITNYSPPLTPPQLLRKNVYLSSSIFPTGDTSGSKLGFIEIYGSLNDTGSLGYDRNYHSYEWQSQFAGSMMTAMAPRPQAVQLKALNTSDPRGQGRQLYQVAFERPAALGDLTLLTLPDARGPHRLIIRQAGAIKWVLRMQCQGVRKWEELQVAAKRLPEVERMAVQQLGDVIPHNFYHDYRIGEEHVEAVDLYGDEASRESLAVLPQFPHLQHLFVTGSNFAAADLTADLEKLTSLKSLRCDDIHLSELLLRAIARLPNLTHLTIEHSSRSEPITDEYLDLLRQSKSLTDLSLSGTEVTDAGLLRLTSMSQLSQLYLDSQAVSDPSVQELCKRLPKCHISINGKTYNGE